MNIRLAAKKDLAELNALFKSVVKDLNDIKKIDMLWGDVYPFCEFEYDIENNEMYVIENENRIIGSFVLSDYDDPEYQEIDWTTNKKFIYLNRLAILPSEQGKGFAKKSMKFIEKYGLDKGYDIIRLTVYQENKYAIGLYEKLGFTRIVKGNWQLEDKIFVGYEKNIK